MAYSNDCYSEIRIMVHLYYSRLQEKTLPARKQEEQNAIQSALDYIDLKYGKHACRFIWRYCIKQDRTMQAAADEAFYSKSQCKRFKREFYRKIAEGLGYL